MSAAIRPSRERANVLLVTPDRRLADCVRQAMTACRFDGCARRVDGHLLAMGEITRCGRPELLLIQANDHLSSLDRLGRSLRDAVPQSTLVLVLPAHRATEAGHAHDDGFDQVLVEPVEPAQIASVIRHQLPDLCLGQPLTVTTDTPATEQAAGHAADEAPTEHAPPGATEPPVSAASTAIAAPAATDATDHSPAATASPTREASPSAPAPPWPDAAGDLVSPVTALLNLTDEPPGSSPSATLQPPILALDDAQQADARLIDRLLNCRKGFKKLALDQLRLLSGLEHAQLADSPQQVPEDCLSIAVSCGQCVHGYLYAPLPVDVEQLEGWAAWLGRWLGLERRIANLTNAALRDPLTGLWSRRYFEHHLISLLHRAQRERFRVTLLMFDIDDFKLYNDQFGHAAGDEILVEAAKLMVSVVRPHDIVARIGGDEFAVVFWDKDSPRRPNSQHPDNAIKAAQRFRQAIANHRFPKLADKARGTLTISGGLATFPWDARTAKELSDLADQRLLQSKGEGKNAIAFGSPE